ncbi:hypothetical protein DFH09DRAFT_1278538, partial [Mycena vulgaris]
TVASSFSLPSIWHPCHSACVQPWFSQQLLNLSFIAPCYLPIWALISGDCGLAADLTSLVVAKQWARWIGL